MDVSLIHFKSEIRYHLEYLFAYFVRRTIMYNSSVFLGFNFFSNYFGIYYRSYLSTHDLGHIRKLADLAPLVHLDNEGSVYLQFFHPAGGSEDQAKEEFLPTSASQRLYLQQSSIQIEHPYTPLSSIPRCSRGNTGNSMIVGILSCGKMES